MTNLGCCVHNCAANSNDLCCLDMIKVEGKGAASQTATHCDSFREKGSSMTNSVNMSNAQPLTEISCNVNTCNYNKANTCNASQIEITGDGASDSYLTNCAKFRKK